eukprot:15550-Heterococcus_DN1.PRE.9
MLSLLEASPGPDINSTLDRSPPSLSFAAFSSANAKPGLISPLLHLQYASHREQYTPQSVHIYCKYFCKAAYVERVYTDCTIDSTLHTAMHASASNIYLRAHEAATAELCTVMHSCAS